MRCAKMDVLEDGDRVVFLRRVVPGGADRSYGLHVAELAGIPRAIVRRAREILADLEGTPSPTGDGQRRSGTAASRRSAMRAAAPDPAPALQMTFFGQPEPALDALKALDVEALSPLEAITKLFELKRLARGNQDR